MKQTTLPFKTGPPDSPPDVPKKKKRTAPVDDLEGLEPSKFARQAR